MNEFVWLERMKYGSTSAVLLATHRQRSKTTTDKELIRPKLKVLATLQAGNWSMFDREFLCIDMQRIIGALENKKVKRKGGAC